MTNEPKRIIPTSLEEAIKLYEEGGVFLDLKICDTKLKSDIIKHAIKMDDLEDQLMILNILNLVKPFNTLDDTYFQAPDIYVNSIEELLDIKLNINAELKEFSKKLIMYFLGIFKSITKTVFTPAEEHVVLPNLFKTLFLLLDFTTLSTILAKCPNFSINEVTYVEDAYTYMFSLISKSNMTFNLINDFCKEVLPNDSGN